MTTNTQKTNNIIAKLLASENISVRRECIRTADFNIVTRTLRLPIWKDMDNSVESMLIAHEVGHALFTSTEYIAKIESLQFPKAQRYVNILEDARTEKFMRRKFAGINKTLTTGYQCLYNKGFFNIDANNIGKLVLLDRINLLMKLGPVINIPFNKEEYHFVEKTQQLETLDDVTKLAQEIYDFAKDIPNDDSNDNSNESDVTIIESDDDSGESNDNNNDDPNVIIIKSNDDNNESTEEGKTKHGEGEGESDIDNSPITNDNLNNNLDLFIDDKTNYCYWKFGEFISNPVIGYKEVFTQIEESSYFSFYSEKYKEEHASNVIKFRQDTVSNVNYLVKEFEMRKSAAAYRKNTVSKSGSLNTNKLFAYQITDDIFRRISITKDDKNHGMIFLLDWSGSMARNIKETLEQLINLVLFCSRAQIKFKVFAFTSNGQYRYTDQEFYKNYIINVERGLSLYEFFSSEMTALEINKMINYLLSPNITNIITLVGTPLLESMVYLYNYIDEYLRKNNIEKFSFITFTDGEGNNFDGQFNEYIFDYNLGKNVRQVHLITCPITKHEYTIKSGNITNQTDIMVNMIKARYNCNIIGFYLLERATQRAINGAINIHYDDSTHKNTGGMVEDIKSQFAKNGFASLNNTAKTAMYVIPSTSLKIKEAELTIKENPSIRSISASFNKYMNTNKLSRVLLNNIVNYIA